MSSTPPDDHALADRSDDGRRGTGVSRMLRPSTLEPVRLDLRRVLLVGIGLWALALVITVVLALTDRTDAVPAAVCGTGIALGGAGLLWERRNRSS